MRAYRVTVTVECDGIIITRSVCARGPVVSVSCRTRAPAGASRAAVRDLEDLATAISEDARGAMAPAIRRGTMERVF